MAGAWLASARPWHACRWRAWCAQGPGWHIGGAVDLAGAREAFEARCLIEVQCAGLAAQRATVEEIAAIRATLDDGEDGGARR